MGRRYTCTETILCTYVARFGRDQFDEQKISEIHGRSISSVRMKVRNIAALLKHKGHEAWDGVAPLTGTGAGLSPRLTDWSVIREYADMEQAEFRDRIRSERRSSAT